MIWREKHTLLDNGAASRNLGILPRYASIYSSTLLGSSLSVLSFCGLGSCLSLRSFLRVGLTNSRNPILKDLTA